MHMEEKELSEQLEEAEYEKIESKIVIMCSRKSRRVRRSVAATRGGVVSRAIGRVFGSRSGGAACAHSLLLSKESMSSAIIVLGGATKVKSCMASPGNGYGCKREKAFHCPNARCTKAYLNSNAASTILRERDLQDRRTRQYPHQYPLVAFSLIGEYSRHTSRLANHSCHQHHLRTFNSQCCTHTLWAQSREGDGGFRSPTPGHALNGSCSTGYFGGGVRGV
ncbi:hypothetical protein BDQ12DRAFT_160973 [Crucibulum laeve]|uniref:Uncharacterized protein n=1 Tax=Crucibulum laeve TaxID=68775 RepID=A0A5C3LW56_9AGAR|nr:hypothetical protein BDQ12DRAFT_160973 [Crucibulum laeve]